MKKSVWLLAIMLLFSMLAACNSESDEKKKNASSEDVVELELYSWRTEDREAYEKIIEVFEEQNPDIKVNFQPYESTEYNTILTNALVSDTGPDIAQLRPYSGSRTIADNDYLLPLDDVDGINDIDDSYLEA